ncbi:MAG TPA: long-chain fatty acid--CoA ligase [Myxococcaceae bacterium]|jgi:fatty-acyl-CoA synthase
MAALNDWLRMRADLTPGRVALVDRVGRRGELTYARWNADADRTARFLAERLGVQRGDRVAVLAMNCVEILDLWFACGKLGAVLQPLNWRLTPVELQDLVRDAGAGVLIYGPDFASQVEVLRAAATPIKRFVALDPEAAGGDVRFSERDRVSGAPVRPAEVGPDDAWVLCYTGGTTGLPKGAVLTYRSILANAVNTIAGWGLTPDDCAVLDAPLFHAGGLNVFTSPLVYAGGRSIVCRSFSADRVLELVASRRISLLFGVPTMFLTLQAHAGFGSVDFSHLKLVITGGAPCPPPVFETFWAQGVDFRMGYGLTEAGPNNFGMPKERVREKLGSVGFPLPQVEVRIARDDGRDCAPGEVGEVLIRGPHVCGGYWQRPEETARAIVDGWLHTGDLGRVDGEGFHAIVGRKKELIISGGENVYPAEIEAVLAGHPAVAEAVVLGAPDPKWGEVPRAVVALKAQASAEELTAFCLQRLGKYKVPRSFSFLLELPKTAAGKVDRRRLQAELSGPTS